MKKKLVIAMLACLLVACGTKDKSETEEYSQVETTKVSEEAEEVEEKTENIEETDEEPLDIEEDKLEISEEENEIYASLLMELVETGTFPATQGVQCDGMPYENTYAILDVDNDEKNELLINYGNADFMAGMVLYVYDYDRTSKEVYVEHSGFPDMTFYENGYIKEGASHNHGRSNLDDFWPYSLYQYNAETDKYEVLANIDAWQYKMYEEAQPDPEFPVEKDLDGDGIVYYDLSEDYYTPTMIMDKAEYDKWCEQYMSGNKKELKEITWQLIITEEEYNEIVPDTAVG